MIRLPVLAAVAALALAACATPGFGPEGTGLGEAPYRVGEILIWIRPAAEVDVLCRVAGARVPDGRRVVGCYVPASRTIIAIDDAWVLMHELKHYFEGRWHDEPSAP